MLIYYRYLYIFSTSALLIIFPTDNNPCQGSKTPPGLRWEAKWYLGGNVINFDHCSKIVRVTVGEGGRFTVRTVRLDSVLNVHCKMKISGGVK